MTALTRDQARLIRAVLDDEQREFLRRSLARAGTSYLDDGKTWVTWAADAEDTLARLADELPAEGHTVEGLAAVITRLSVKDRRIIFDKLLQIMCLNCGQNLERDVTCALSCNCRETR